MVGDLCCVRYQMRWRYFSLCCFGMFKARVFAGLLLDCRSTLVLLILNGPNFSLFHSEQICLTLELNFYAEQPELLGFRGRVCVGYKMRSVRW